MSNKESFSQFKETLRKLSAHDFRRFGVQDIAYVRTIIVQGKTLFIVNTADGQKISVANTMMDAVSLARQNDLEPVTVH